MSDEVLEALRLRAIRARELGFKCDDVANIFGVAPETVSRWWSAYTSGGVERFPEIVVDAPMDRDARSRLSKKNRFSNGWWRRAPKTTKSLRHCGRDRPSPN